MDTSSDYDAVCAWLAEWPDGCTITHLGNKFRGARPKNNITKWLQKCDKLTVFDYEGIANGAVRLTTCPQPSVAMEDTMPDTWTTAFLNVIPPRNPPYALIEETPTQTLVFVRAWIQLRKEQLLALLQDVEKALDERGWSESEQP